MSLSGSRPSSIADSARARARSSFIGVVLLCLCFGLSCLQRAMARRGRSVGLGSGLVARTAATDRRAVQRFVDGHNLARQPACGKVFGDAGQHGGTLASLQLHWRDVPAEGLHKLADDGLRAKGLSSPPDDKFRKLSGRWRRRGFAPRTSRRHEVSRPGFFRSRPRGRVDIDLGN